ncbi:MAG TPA: S9 family peptidase [Gemmatimonadales bacterium]|jgi:oligopeptidase B
MPTPPRAPRHPASTTRHGETFTDDFAWLRDKDDPATIAYLEAENAYANEVLAPTDSLQETLYREMLGRIKETDLSVPVRRDGYWYYTRTEEGKQYGIQCRRRESMDSGAEEIVLDLNLLAAGKPFMALGDYVVSDDARFLAYSTDETGFRQYTLEVKDLATGDLLGLRRERVTSIAWTTNGRELFYTVEDEVTKRSHQLWRHRFGEPADTLIYQEDDEAFGVHVGRTRSRAWLVLHCGSHTTSETRVLPAAGGAASWQTLLPREAEIEYDIDHFIWPSNPEPYRDVFVIRINDTGRNFRLVTAPVGDVRRERFREILAHRDTVMIEGHDCFARHLVVSEREDGVPQIAVARVDAPGWRRMTFPEPAYEAYLHSNPEWDVDRIRIGYQSLVTPSSVFDCDLDSDDRTLLKQQEVVGGYDSSAYVSERIHATAADGTSIPVSIVRRRDTGHLAPCLLHGYGSYGYSYPVAFSSNRLSLLDRGMVVAIAHIRGGGELGKKWHDAGRMEEKMNTFTDFIEAAESLIERGIVARDALVIEGGSAGGLLMGAVTNLRPDLFRAVVSQVPFVDVINTMSDPSLPLTVGEYEEWGNPAIAEQFGWMRAYDPYLNLRKARYPAILVRTSLNDSQVMYWEPAKYVAKLREFKEGSTPLLLLTNMGAGHGGASGRYDRLREIATDYAFILTEATTPTAAPTT